MLEPTFRPLITIIRLLPDGSGVEVALDLDGRMATGFAEISAEDPLSAACRATVTAVQSLLPGEMTLRPDWHRRIDGHEGLPDVINSAVTLQVGDARQEEHLIGAAYVRHDPCVAAVRATLDGLTRRLITYIFT